MEENILSPNCLTVSICVDVVEYHFSMNYCEVDRFSRTRLIQYLRIVFLFVANRHRYGILNHRFRKTN